MCSSVAYHSSAGVPHRTPLYHCTSGDRLLPGMGRFPLGWWPGPDYTQHLHAHYTLHRFHGCNFGLRNLLCSLYVFCPAACIFLTRTDTHLLVAPLPHPCPCVHPTPRSWPVPYVLPRAIMHNELTLKSASLYGYLIDLITRWSKQ